MIMFRGKSCLASQWPKLEVDSFDPNLTGSKIQDLGSDGFGSSDFFVFFDLNMCHFFKQVFLISVTIEQQKEVSARQRVMGQRLSGKR